MAQSVSTNLPPEQQREMLRRMLTIRRFEERASADYLAGKIYGVVHCYIGEEAVAVGVCSALAPGDQIISTHRGHGHCIAKGVDVRPMMAELYGKATGTNRGKGGSMHITDITKGMLGVNPILGMGTPHAVGAAISARVRKTGQIVATFFGDGAASIGAVHESMNMASIWKLPVIFVCENNGYAQSTPVEYAISVQDIAIRGASYNMPGVVVDGQDVFAVWGATAEAVRRARAGEGPSLIECKTYRYFGHHAGDNPRSYRFEDEETMARSRDCLKRFRARVVESNLLTIAELDAVDALNQVRMDEAVAFAETSPLPDPAELTTDVYSAEPAEFQTERLLSTSQI